ncbi:LAETG motif-containing sortase-dependent surface protein [Kitasatospora cathayae]|uniref:LPXTG cell wall anchor domain-containing protein n=1 Tax=Kitasatospora cathayae TaxID=3004092 RepID=A0ABY7Q4U1_9ACTN|nr:LAETG motif-containing sortase-dependent surface protein [Kitasatospora sp. HUAS 3-15]WBP87730.1 LPXTG cell wall anchor domain-containing protein [Kitasatospora sp. HUAS 3-15]
MRSSRFIAASTLVALALGATVGAATAGAVGITGSPIPTGTATAAPSAPTTAAPSTTATAPGTPAPTAPTIKPIPKPTIDNRCHGGVYQSSLLKVTGTGLYGTTLIKGGPAAEVTLTWENNSGVDLPVVHNSFYVTDEFDFDGGRPVHWNTGFLDVQLNTGDGWKPGQLNDRIFRVPDFKLAKGEKLTYKVRIAATAKAPAGRYGANYEAASDAFDNDKVPTPANNQPQACTQFLADYLGEFHVAEAGGATTPAAVPAAAVSASPSAGPHLAETGASSDTLPIALGGAVVLAVGAGTLFVLRRRKAGTHG